ncbi:MAG: tetratricopeptide repeat protein [Vicinamibacterales bacterium]
MTHVAAVARIVAIVAFVLPVTAAAQPSVSAEAPATIEALKARALQFGYNLDYDQALAAFREAIAADPSDSNAHRLAAATVWISTLFQQGAVTAEDYLGQARSDVTRQPVAPDLAAAFQTHISRALALAEQRVRDRPNDADAHFQLGAAYGYLTTYKATVEGRIVGGFRTARRAYSENERALALDPRRRDAGLTVGMYRYAVSSLSAPLRLLAGIAGFGGGRERGLRLIEDAAAYPSDTRTNARFTLIVIYNREQRYDDALRVIRELQQAYPRNRLLWLEAGSTALRARRFEDARAAIAEGMDRLSRDARSRAYGEDARWRYCRGAALVGLRRIEVARDDLRAVLDANAPEWLHGRAHKELGKIADLSGDRARALDEYRMAHRICREQRDGDCADESAALIDRPYR